MRRVHLRPRRLRLPLAAIARRHAALLAAAAAAAAEGGGRGDGAVAGDDRTGEKRDGADGGTAAEVLQHSAASHFLGGDVEGVSGLCRRIVEEEVMGRLKSRSLRRGEMNWN